MTKAIRAVNSFPKPQAQNPPAVAAPADPNISLPAPHPESRTLGSSTRPGVGNARRAVLLEELQVQREDKRAEATDKHGIAGRSGSESSGSKHQCEVKESPHVSSQDSEQVEFIDEQATQARLEKIAAKGKSRSPEKGLLELRLNKYVEVPTGDGNSNASQELVVCRHFVTAFSEHTGKKRELMASFSEASGIKTLFGGRLTDVQETHLKGIREAPLGCKHVVRADELGLYLVSMAKALNEVPEGADRPSQANCLLFTDDHGMALHLERKKKNGVDYFAVKLYDPEGNTANYKRTEWRNPEGLTPQAMGSLSLEDMMMNPNLSRIYRKYSSEPLSMVAVCLDHRLQPDMDRSATVPSAANMRVAMRYGVTDEFHAMMQSAEKTHSPKQLFELLCARKKGFDANQGIYVALKTYGGAKMIREFAEAVLDSKILGKQAKLQLLEAKGGDKVTVLNAAFTLGRTDEMKAFVEVVLRSDHLDNKEKVHLLTAKGSDGLSGPYISVKKGHKGMSLAFFDMVSKSSLDHESMQDIFRASLEF